MDHALLVKRRQAGADERVDLADILVHARPEVDGEAERLEAPVRVGRERGGERVPVERVERAEEADVARDGAHARGGAERGEQRGHPGQVRGVVHREAQRERVERGAAAERDAVRQEDGCGWGGTGAVLRASVSIIIAVR